MKPALYGYTLRIIVLTYDGAWHLWKLKAASQKQFRIALWSRLSDRYQLRGTKILIA